MKMWRGFGSEHSANLMMIGRFTSADDAEVALKEFERITEIVQSEFDEDEFEEDDSSIFLNEAITSILTGLKLYDFSARDVEHFVREHSVRRQGAELRIWTDDTDVNGFLKFLLNKRARIEVYSVHDFPDEQEPRGT